MYLPLITVACASQAPPGGGPEDKTPPEVVSTVPSADSTRVGRVVTAEIVFSEAMDEASTENAIFISPQPRRDPRLSWRGTSLRIALRDSLPDNVTCVITVGTAAKDLRNNPLKRAVTFAFATGDSIDRGKISGRMITDQTAGVAVWAYRSGEEPDSTLLKRRADYITQLDREGRYELAYLAPGSYRVFGIADVDENRRFTPGVDYIGLPSFEPVIENRRDEVTSVNGLMSLHDTTAFRVVDAEFGGREVRVHFSKALAVLRYVEDGFFVDSLKERVKISSRESLLTIRDMLIDPKSESTVHVLLETLPSDSLQAVVSGFISHSGDTLQPATLPVKFSEFDTVTTVEVVQPAARSTVGPDMQVELRFSRGIDRSTVTTRIFLLDTSQQRIDGVIRWKNSSHLIWTGSRLLNGPAAYRLMVSLDSIADWLGRRIADTTLVWEIQTYKPDTLGTVRGRIDEDGDHLVQITRIGQPSFSRRQLLRGAVEFTFDHLLPGRYNLTAFRDDDGSGRYSYGRLTPWKPSEVFVSYPDTVSVRSHWETSNVNVQFKKP